MLTIGSLFSGIGGLEYGAELTGAGNFKTVWHCEIDPYASAVLRKHFPGTPNLGNIQLVDWGSVERPDIVCGGFPCQDISVAGKGAGIKEGTRSGLWFEFAKCIRALRPRYVVVENVPMLVKRGLHLVLADLAEAGYDAEWHNISASSVGAWHRRERIFIIAYARHNSKRTPRESMELCNAGDNVGKSKSERWKERNNVADGLCELSEIKTDVPNPMRGGCDGGECDREKRHLPTDEERDMAQTPERRQSQREPPTCKVGDVPDTSLAGLERGEETRNLGSRREDTEQFVARQCGENRHNIWQAEPDVGGTLDGFSTWLDKSEEGKQMIINTHKQIMAYGNANKTNTEETLRLLWGGYGTQEDRKQIGRQGSISSEEVLLTYLRQLTQASKTLDNLSPSSAEVQEEILRSLPADNKFACTSHRPRPKEQHTGKYPNTMCILPQLLALNAEEAWCAFRNENATTLHFYWESGIARVADGVPNRVDRIKCLGNAVVPQAAQVVWEMILEREQDRRARGGKP